MLANQKPKWKRFEALVAQVQKTLSPEAQVSLDQKIMGRRSKRWRKPDIVVRQNVGQYNILIVMECKDHKESVDINDIEGFIGLVEDIGANKGAMVSASGFTEAAKTRADGCGIDLYTLVDAEAHDWQTYISIPILCDVRAIYKWRAKFRAAPHILQWLSEKDYGTLTLYDSNGSLLGTIPTLLGMIWNRQEIPSEPGTYEDFKLYDGITIIRLDDERFAGVEASIDVRVGSYLYFGQLPITRIKGFRDEVTGGLLTRGFETDWLDIREVERTWLKVTSEEILAVKPLLVLRARSTNLSF